MKLIDAKDFKPKPGDHWLDITEGMSGHFVVEMWMNPGEKDGDAPPISVFEPYDTPSRVRWPTAKEAWEEAKEFAKGWFDGEIPLINHPELESAEKPKSDYEKWLDQMDSHRPDWAYEFATQEETRDLFYTLMKGYRNAETAQARLRERVGQRLFVAVKAWVALEVCPICGDEVVLAQRRRADDVAKKEPAAARGVTSPAVSSPKGKKV